MSHPAGQTATAASHSPDSTAATPSGGAPTSGISVALPPRQPTDSGARAVWSFSERANDDASPAAGASADGLVECDKHNRRQSICCKDLKGDDERWLINPDIVRDIIIGLSDGLTVPFGLTAGLSGLGSSRLVVVGGLAELISGAISMGVGGYLASEAERDHFRYMQRTTRDRVRRSCAGEMEREVHEVLGPLGIDQGLSRRVAAALLKVEDSLAPPSPTGPAPGFWRSYLERIGRRPRFGDGSREGVVEDGGKLRWSDEVGMTAFLLKLGEGMEEVPTSRLYISAATIGLSYAIGGLVPMAPYFFISDAMMALYVSAIVMFLTLLIFGCFKAYFTGAKIGFAGYLKASSATIVVGGFAAAASYGIVKLLEQP